MMKVGVLAKRQLHAPVDGIGRGICVLGDTIALRYRCLPDHADLGKRDSAGSRKLSCKLIVHWCNCFAGLVPLVVDYKH